MRRRPEGEGEDEVQDNCVCPRAAHALLLVELGLGVHGPERVTGAGAPPRASALIWYEHYEPVTTIYPQAANTISFYLAGGHWLIAFSRALTYLPHPPRVGLVLFMYTRC